MKRIIFGTALCFAITAFALPLALPDAAIRGDRSDAPLFDGTDVTPRVAAIFERSCQDCHSLKTRWPSYSKVFPVSRMIESDVQNARTHMNLSSWQIYDPQEKSAILAEIGSVVRNRVMPPRRYTLIHWNARLSASDIDEIYRWTRSQRKLLESSDERPAK